MLDNSLTVVYTDDRTIEDIPIELWERTDDCEVTNGPCFEDRDEDQDALPADKRAQALRRTYTHS